MFDPSMLLPLMMNMQNQQPGAAPSPANDSADKIANLMKNPSDPSMLLQLLGGGNANPMMQMLPTLMQAMNGNNAQQQPYSNAPQSAPAAPPQEAPAKPVGEQFRPLKTVSNSEVNFHLYRLMKEL